MAKKHSLRSYLMMAKSHSKKDRQDHSTTTDAKKKKRKSSQVEAEEEQVGRDNFGAQTSDERTTTKTTTTNESIQTANSIAGDSSSGYHSVAATGHSNGANQFYPAAARQQQPKRHYSATERLAANGQQRQQRQQRQLVMVNERISGEKSRDTTPRMWPVMIDDELGGGVNGSDQQNIGACNKVHLIDDDYDDDDDDDAIGVDVEIDSYDIDSVAAANEVNNNISDRFHRHRYCADSRSSPTSRFDESFQLERQRHQQQQQQQLQPAANNAAHHHRQPPQQYFHQAVSNYHQQQPSSLHFEPSHHQQHSSLLNSAGSSATFSQQQQRFVNYIRQQPAADIFAPGQLQYPIPPTNYSQQQYHTLVQYHPTAKQPYSYTDNNFIAAATGNRKLTDPSSADSSNSNSHHPQQNSLTHNQQRLASLTPSGATATIMQPANSRQFLTAAPDSHHHHHHHHQQQQPRSSRRKGQPSSGGQARGAGNHVRSSSSSSKNKPTLDCCGKLAKFLLFTMNLLFWSAGIALGAWGVLSLVEDHKYNLSQLLVFEPNSRMSLFQLLSWSFITLGCATILVGFCGCSAIFKNNRWILGLYIFLVLAIFALDLATGLLAIIFQEKLVANVRLRLGNKLRADYGVQASFTAAIDYIQTKFECCGLEGHFDYDQSVWRLQRLGGFEATVARTCCHLRNTFDDQAHINPRPVNESMCQSTDVRFHQSYRYRKGCLDDLERLVRHKIWTFTLGCAAVGGVILLSLMFATCFCRSIKSYSNSRKESPSSIGDAASSSPKRLDNSNNKSAGRHFTSSGHQISSQRHHQHK